MHKSGAGAPIEINYKLELKLPKPGYQVIPPFEKPPALMNEFIGIIKPVDVIVAKHGFQIVWAIINYTDQTLKVMLDQFVDMLGSPAADPVQFAPGVNPKTVKPYSVDIIKGKVKNKAVCTKYSYRILIDGQPALDPELDIEKPATVLP